MKLCSSDNHYTTAPQPSQRLTTLTTLATTTPRRVTLAYSHPCQIPSPGIWHQKHIQNPVKLGTDQSLAIVRTVYSGTIHPYSGIFRTSCNACICRNLAFSKSWNIQNSSMIAFRKSEPWNFDNPRIFRTLTYLII